MAREIEKLVGKKESGSSLARVLYGKIPKLGDDVLNKRRGVGTE